MATHLLGNISLPFSITVRGVNAERSDGSGLYSYRMVPPYSGEIVNGSGIDVSSAFSITILYPLDWYANIGQIRSVPTNAFGWLDDGDLTTTHFVKTGWKVDLIGTPTGPGPFTLKAKFFAWDQYTYYPVSEDFQFIFDSIPPTVTITPPSGIVTVGGINYIATNPTSVSISAVDNTGGTGVKNITPTIDGAQQSAVSATSTTVSVSGTGSHTVSAISSDHAGNISSPVSYTFYIDDVPPTGSISLASSETIFTIDGKEYINHASPDLEFTFADADSGVKDLELVLNGASYSTYTTALTSPYTETIPDTATVEGKNTATLTVKDKVDNTYTTAEYVFYIDTTPPDGYIVVSTQDSVRESGGVLYTKETDVNVNLHFGDGGTDPSGLGKGLIKVNDSSTPTVADFSSGIDLSSETSPKNDYNVTGLTASQSNDLTFFTMDKVENISAGDTVSVYVDQTDPTGAITISSSQTVNVYTDSITYASSSSMKVKLTHSDSESGLF